MTTGSMNDKRRSSHPFTSRSAERVERVLETFMHSLQKSTHQAARKSRLIKHTILSVLHKKLHYHPWDPHYVPELKPADYVRRMEYGELMLGWHGVYGKIYVVILLNYDGLAKLAYFKVFLLCSYVSHISLSMHE